MDANAFWDWFVENETFVRDAIDHRDEVPHARIFSDFFLEMETYYAGLSYMLAPHPRRPDLYRFTISPQGDRSLLLPINHLVKNAPQVPKWKFKAGFGPEEIEEEFFDIYEDPYTFLDFTFKPEEIGVFALRLNPENKRTELQFLLPFRYSTYDQDDLLGAFEFFLMELVGEMTVFERIDFCTITYHNEDPFVPLDCIELLLDSSEDGTLYGDAAD